MGGNPRKGKARNQMTGSHRHVDDAAWFKNNNVRQRKRNKIARQSRRKNRKQ